MKFIFGLSPTVLLIILACDPKTGVESSPYLEQWMLVTSNCGAKHYESYPAHCRWVYDIYTFELSPFRIIPLDSSNYDYSCPDFSCVVSSQQRYTGFFIRTRGNLEQGPPNMLFSETTLKYSSSSNGINVITTPDISVCGYPLEEPWYQVGLSALTAFLFFPRVPDEVQEIVLELPYKDEGNIQVFSITFKRIV